MNTSQPDPDLTRDEHLRAALRHAPDASLGAPAAVSQQIRAAALRAAVATASAPTRAEPSVAVAATAAPSSRLTLWRRLWTGSGRAERVGAWTTFATAATLATVVMATLLAGVWDDTTPPRQEDKRVAMALPQPDLAAQRSAPMPTAERLPTPAAPAQASDQALAEAPPPATPPRPAARQAVPAAPSHAPPRTAMAEPSTSASATGATAQTGLTAGPLAAGARPGLNAADATTAPRAPSVAAAAATVATASTAASAASALNAEAALRTSSVSATPTAPTTTSSTNATNAAIALRAPTAVVAAAAPPAPTAQTAATLADSANPASSTSSRAFSPGRPLASAPVPHGVSVLDFAAWLDQAATGPDAPTLLTELAAVTRGRWLPVDAPPAGAPAVVLPTQRSTPTVATLTLQADAAWGCLTAPAPAPAPAPRCQRASLTAEQASLVRELLARRN